MIPPRSSVAYGKMAPDGYPLVGPLQASVLMVPNLASSTSVRRCSAGVGRAALASFALSASMSFCKSSSMSGCAAVPSSCPDGVACVFSARTRTSLTGLAPSARKLVCADTNGMEQRLETIARIVVTPCECYRKSIETPQPRLPPPQPSMRKIL